jgi:hypothetical protein
MHACMGASLVCVSLRLAASVVTIIHILVQCHYLCKLCTILSTEVIYAPNSGAVYMSPVSRAGPVNRAETLSSQKWQGKVVYLLIL